MLGYGRLRAGYGWLCWLRLAMAGYGWLRLAIVPAIQAMTLNVIRHTSLCHDHDTSSMIFVYHSTGRPSHLINITG